MLRIKMAILAAVTCVFTAQSVDAGVFRDRSRFNEKGPGFWMKGRCVIPKNPIGWQDDNHVIKDLGCVVKNRKGKRRPRRSRANVIIQTLAWESDAASLMWIEGTSCSNARRCSSKVFRNSITRDSVTRFKPNATINCIIGWKDDRTEAKAFIVRVGTTPTRDHPRFGNEIRRFEDNCV